GFRFAGPAGGETWLEGSDMRISRRSWWVQLEALRALASPVGAPARFAREWAFFRDHMLDRQFGGVFPTCPADLRFWRRPYGRARNAWDLRKGHEWKDASHETDALLECVARLRGRPGLLDQGAAAIA